MSSSEPEPKSESDPEPLPTLTACIVGAGPSGLLLAHRLLSSPLYDACVTVYESRSDPRRRCLGDKSDKDKGKVEGKSGAVGSESISSAQAEAAVLEGRAYALGLNGRSRLAICSVRQDDDGDGDSDKDNDNDKALGGASNGDPGVGRKGGDGEGEGPKQARQMSPPHMKKPHRLWEEVKSRGYESDKFALHVGAKIKFQLRDGAPKIPTGFFRRYRGGKREGGKGDDDDDEEENSPVEPSVLIYQSDLCSALLDELENRFGRSVVVDDHGGGSGSGRDIGGGNETITCKTVTTKKRERRRSLDLNFDSRVVRVDANENVVDVLVRSCARDSDNSADADADGSSSRDEDGGHDGSDAAQGSKSSLRTSKRFDLLVGCDGVNSKVRNGMIEAAPKGSFECMARTLPGSFKVARLPRMPPKLAPDSVALLLPTFAGGGGGRRRKRGATFATTAFVEPVRDGGACILFAGGRGGREGDNDENEDESESKSDADAIDPILGPPRRPANDDKDGNDAHQALASDLLGRFPLLEGLSDEDVVSVARQLSNQRPARASAVKCNVYHYRSTALCGDAAHATGGVSGQGVNSAFVDSMVLADCLDLAFSERCADSNADADATRSAIRMALLQYSKKQVPEGTALYDLSFGSDGELPALTKLWAAITTARDAIFGGRLGIGEPVLQVQLSSTLRSFADVRRSRWRYYGDGGENVFPDQDEWSERIEAICRGMDAASVEEN